jgi:8-oxo-dGTP pyrophosphatase MutT (NUDIX family)
VPRDAATVMLVRDGGAGLEVFMLRRNPASVFVGGAYVFPGGAVDDADRHADLESVCTGRTDAGASAVLGIDGGGLAYWVAAVRECFEEAGVLLAHPTGEAASTISLADEAVAARFEAYRAAVYAGDLRLVDLCRREALFLAADQIHYFSHWITPVGAPRRYDTRFFVAAAPPEQTPLHDERETIANVWVRPADALARFDAGEYDLIFPTIKSLQAIGQFSRTEQLLAAAALAEASPDVHPRLQEGGEGEHGVRILLPGDPGYDDVLSRG